MIKSDTYDYQFIKKTQKFGRLNLKKVISNQYIDTTRKIQMILYSYCFNVYKIVYNKYIKKKR